MSIGTIIGIAASAAVLAHSAAAKRNRSPQGWAVLAFLFPIALLVLWCLSARPQTAVPTSRQPAAPAAKAPVAVSPSGWADSLAPSSEQHAATSERGMPAASLAESW